MAARKLRKGSHLGKYRLDGRLGEGSGAVVWRARDLVEARPVALKVVHPDLVSEFGRDAIEHEARIGSRLRHPNIVSVRNADWIDDYFVMASDLAQRSLADYPGARRSPQVALSIIRDAAHGLAFAHRAGVMHRDVKPPNILVFRDRSAGLCDFGVARAVEARTRGFTEAGTFGYMAPEQAYGRPRPASDVFSLGLIAWELLAGMLPSWPFEWPYERAERMAARTPEPVQRVLRRSLQVDLKRRYPDGLAFAQALDAALEADRQQHSPRPTRRRRKRAPQRTPLEVQAELFRKRHRHALGLRYDCHRCGGPISEEMAVCPWCGTADNSLQDISVYPLVCPDCEHGVLPEWTACPWCYPGRLQGNGRPVRPDPQAERRCSRPGCGGQLRRFMRYCPVCKQKPRRLWSHPDLPERCPRCRGPVSRAFWRFCAWCGRREPRAAQFDS